MKMIKKKLIALISTLSLVSVVGVATAVSANAANLELKYNEELSSSTVKVVDINYNVESSLYTLGGKLKLNYDGATAEYEGLIQGDTPDWMQNGSLYAFAWSDFNMSFKVASSGTVGRFKITVPEGTPEFTIDFTEIALECYESTYDVADITVTIPGATVEEEESETIAATPAGKFEKWADAKTQAFKANLTAAQAAKTVTWKVTGEVEGVLKEKTAAANLGTVTGINMVIGLIVTNAVDGLTATVVVE
jgi:hypothetical protein